MSVVQSNNNGNVAPNTGEEPKVGPNPKHTAQQYKLANGDTLTVDFSFAKNFTDQQAKSRG